MSENGFHVGHVQPEWLDSGGEGCYSLILNNDNGLSRRTTARPSPMLGAQSKSESLRA